MMGGGGCVSAYTEECLPQKSGGSVRDNTCSVTHPYARRLLIAPPKIEHHHHHHHLCCLACSTVDKH